MTDKLKCPFCGSELRTSMLDESVAWYCPNRCIGTYEPKVWRALITGKKAQDALKHLSQELCYLCMDEKSTKANLYKQINELLIYSHNAIGEITSITKGKDNDLGTVD